MKVSKKIIGFLEKEGVKYQLINHKTVYTAIDKSATLRENPKIIAKTVIVKGDNFFFIAVIPSDKNLDVEKIKKVLNTERKKRDEKPIKKISFAGEKWISNNFKGVKMGAIPPFEKLFNLQVVLDKTLLKNKKIYFSAGDYNNSIIITPKEFKKISSDLIEGSFSLIKKKKKKKIKKKIKDKKEKNVKKIKKETKKPKKKTNKKKIKSTKTKPKTKKKKK